MSRQNDFPHKARPACNTIRQNMVKSETRLAVKHGSTTDRNP